MTLTNRIVATEGDRKIWHQERTVFELTELICELIEKAGINRSQLAKRIGTTRGYVSQLLDGEHNMTIKTASDIFLAFGKTLHFSYTEESTEVSSPAVSFKMKWGTPLPLPSSKIEIGKVVLNDG